MDETPIKAEENGSSKVRLSKDQVGKLAKAVNAAQAEEVELSHGTDGRLIVREVKKIERMKALKLY